MSDKLSVMCLQSVTLRWMPPSSTTSESGEPCPVQKYMIRLRQHGVRKSRAWKLEPDRLSVSLHDLRPETEYRVQLFLLPNLTLWFLTGTEGESDKVMWFLLLLINRVKFLFLWERDMYSAT